MAPGESERAMAALLVEGTRHLADAFDSLAQAERGPRSEPIPRQATDCADAAIKSQRRLERVYRSAMSALIDEEDLREVMGRRELLRRLARVGDTLIEVAERLWYAGWSRRAESPWAAGAYGRRGGARDRRQLRASRDEPDVRGAARMRRREPAAAPPRAGRDRGPDRDPDEPGHALQLAVVDISDGATLAFPMRGSATSR